ncbi:MAG TPA: DHA2 family efflux MFS transporter permease subunit [Nonomuraea sp.]|nr:DHA2 family efflux MFS transporter permease subunit [Nonomuraea sp.]
MTRALDNTPPDPATRQAPAPSSSQRWALILGALTSFVVGLDALVVATALPTLHQQYGSGVEQLSWTVNAYQLAFAASILTGSSLGDRLGRRPMFIIGLMLFGLASALCALSPNLAVLIAARALQGVGAGIAVPLALALITDLTPPHLRGKALGIWGAVTGVAVAAGPLVGGAIIEGLTWQWIFWLNVPVTVGIAVAAHRKISHSTATTATLDPAGLALATAGVFGLVYALIMGNSTGWTSPPILAAFVVGAVALALFVVWESRTGHPMLPLSMFANRGFTASCVAGFTLMAGVFGLGFLTAQYLQLALGRGPLAVGLGLLPATALALPLSPLAGRLADRLGERPLVAAGLALQGLGLALIGILVTDTSGYATIVGPLAITGAGVAIAFPTAASSAMRSAGPAEAGIASGISNTFRQAGAVFGVAMCTAIFAANGNYRTAGDFIDGYSPAFVTLGALCCATALIQLALHPARNADTDAVIRPQPS